MNIRFVIRERIFGKKDLSLHEKISFDLIFYSLIFALITTPVNFSLNLNLLGYLSASACIILGGLLYLLSFTKIYNVVVVIYSIYLCLLLMLIWFANAGSWGPTSALFIILVCIQTAIAPIRYQFLIVLFIIFILAIVFILEILYPQLVIHYPGVVLPYSIYNKDRIVDWAVTYLFCVLMAFWATRTLRKNYENESKQVKKQNEEILAQAEMLEEQNNSLAILNETKNKIFSIISHDLRAPVISAHAGIQFLEDQENELDQEGKQGLLNQVSRKLYYTLELLDNLLYWSKAQMEGIHVQKQVVWVAKLLKECSQLFEDFASSKSLHFDLHIQEEYKKLRIMADPAMIETIVRNLVSNAIKFTPYEGSISIKLYQEYHQVIICVQDTGVGIPVENQNKIFGDKLFSTSGTESEKGNGLGLKICKEFVEKNDGQIWFESIPQKGTTFYVSFPLIQ